MQIIEESVAGSVSQTESRKNVMLDFYVRPTIPFEPECESRGYKKNLVSEISLTAETLDSISFASLSLSTAGVATGFIMACISHCLYGCTYFLKPCVKDESVHEKIGTVYLSMQTFCSVIFVAMMSVDFFAFPARK